MFNVSTLTVTSAGNSKIIENAAFARMEMEGRLMSTCQFSHSIQTEMLEQRMQLIEEYMTLMPFKQMW